MVKEFADAAFAMKPGDVSQPVKSQFGWHVIKLEEQARTKPVPTFDQVKPQIARYLTAEVAAGPHPEAAHRGQDREARAAGASRRRDAGRCRRAGA